MKPRSTTPRRHALLALAAVTFLSLATVATAQTLFVSTTPDDTVTIFATGLMEPQLRGTTGSIAGTVTDSASTNPIVGATVDVVVGGTTYLTTTPSDGTYAIMNVPAGTGYTVTASADFYLNEDVPGVNVVAGTTTSGINFALSLAEVPEPSTFALLAGVAALGFVGWRRRRTA